MDIVRCGWNLPEMDFGGVRYECEGKVRVGLSSDELKTLDGTLYSTFNELSQFIETIRESEDDDEDKSTSMTPAEEKACGDLVLVYNIVIGELAKNNWGRMHNPSTGKYYITCPSCRRFFKYIIRRAEEDIKNGKIAINPE